MKRLIALGVCLIVGIELLALILDDRRFVLAASGAATALVLLNIRRFLGHGTQPAAEPDADDLGDALRRWLVTHRDDDPVVGLHAGRTGTGICVRCWHDGSKSPPDTGRPKIRTAFHASGQMLFGAELWEWVNPNNVTRTGAHEPGPGRAKLEEILQRLEQV